MQDVKFEDIQKANKTINTTNIKGKDYAEVNQRVKAFRMLYPAGTIKTIMLSNEGGVCIFQATVSDGETVLATGTAYEKEGNSFINKTSYIENCETSAVGRALGFAGFGIDTSIASAEEVSNAIQQQNEDKVISKTMQEALNQAIENHNIADDVVALVLEGYGYTSTSEIKAKDYKNIVEDLKPKK